MIAFISTPALAKRVIHTVNLEHSLYYSCSRSAVRISAWMESRASPCVWGDASVDVEEEVDPGEASLFGLVCVVLSVQYATCFREQRLRG